MTRRRKGFTLIELLVVIAIIGILAAMIFPVFARARDAARKAVCLTNMKNICTAMQMYLQDNNMVTPPIETRPEVIDWFHTQKAYTPPATDPGRLYNGIQQCNPYLRWPVILDPYIQNRDVWRCPAARTVAGATWIIPEADWFQYVVNNWALIDSSWPCKWSNPGESWPNGWGGPITDSLNGGAGPCTLALALHQGGIGGSRQSMTKEGAFIMGIGYTDQRAFNVDTGSDDPGWFALFADTGCGHIKVWNASQLMFPEVCHLGIWCCHADWTNCRWTRTCGVGTRIATDTDGPVYSALAREGYTRHLGGVNVGFADGHAQWFMSEAIQGMLPSCAAYRYTCVHPGLAQSVGCSPLA